MSIYVRDRRWGGMQAGEHTELDQEGVEMEKENESQKYSKRGSWK